MIMISITWAGPSCVQEELGTFLAPQNRTQGRCDSHLNLNTDQFTFTHYCEVGCKSMIFRVMDPSLLKTSNLHEVKHWVEPGEAVTSGHLNDLLSINMLELISFGWGQFDYHEEAKMLDQKHLRKISKNQFVA